MWVKTGIQQKCIFQAGLLVTASNITKMLIA
jgi:hypothetical protein